MKRLIKTIEYLSIYEILRYEKTPQRCNCDEALRVNNAKRASGENNPVGKGRSFASLYKFIKMSRHESYFLEDPYIFVNLIRNHYDKGLTNKIFL